jgi:hypothetical protein
MGVKLHPTAAFSLRKSHRNSLTRELGASRRQSRRLEEGKNFFPQLEMKPRFLGLPACGPGTVLNGPSCLLNFEWNRPNICKLAYVVEEFKIQAAR